MGTWGEGLYDNDSALDCLGDLLQIDDDVHDIIELTTRIGLASWLNPSTVSCDEGELKERVEALGAELERLPEETREALKTVLADPKTALDGRSRKPEVKDVLGGYSDGPRLDALLRFPGAQPIIDSFGEQLAEELDGTLTQNSKIDLYQLSGSMAILGLLIELTSAGFFQPAPGRVEQWRLGFGVIDKATKSERGFWWKYVRRVQAGFDLLAPRPAGTVPVKPAAKTKRPDKPIQPVALVPAGPVERYHHPKLGLGTLVGRSGRGDEEKLDLRFHDGQIRKILAKFVTRYEE